MKNHRHLRLAFTLIELAIVLATLALLAAMLLPALAATRPKVQKIACVNNLRQIGVAFSIWQGNNSDRYPMVTPLVYGGASEYLTHSSGSVPPGLESASYCPGMAFMVMSNEFSSATLLHCPADTIHNQATNFSYLALLGEFTPASGAHATAPSSISAISYFVGGDATQADPNSILAGDCNIGTAGPTTGNHAATWRFGNTSATTPTANPGPLALAEAIGTAAFSTFTSGEWAWTTNDLHRSTGNLLIADGSVQITSITGLKSYLQNATNSVLDPVVNFIW